MFALKNNNNNNISKWVNTMIIVLSTLILVISFIFILRIFVRNQEKTKNLK